MKQLSKILCSTKTTLVLLVIFMVAVGVATFIEEFYDLATAKKIVYNARWLELIYLLLVINFIGNIKKYKLLSKAKIPGFLFHGAFIVMIIGAGITRYTGYEGMMHIREGSSSNVLYTSKAYLRIIAPGDQGKSIDYPIMPGDGSFNSFKLSVKGGKGENIEVKYKGYIKDAGEFVKENAGSGKSIVEMKVSRGGGMSYFYITEGERTDIGGVKFSLNGPEAEVRLFTENNEVFVKSNLGLSFFEKKEEGIKTLESNKSSPFNTDLEYGFRGIVFSFSKLYSDAETYYKSVETRDPLPDVVMVELRSNDMVKEVAVSGGPDYVSTFREFEFNDNVFQFAYGDKPVELPFSLYLDDFKLERYAGSNSPSSYSSDVIVVDQRDGSRKSHQIYMNNVLDYDGYRFFQSSYDKDEKGTVLSVNHDLAGTAVTYFGYFLLGLGLLLTLFNKGSRFYTLRKNIKEIREQRKAEILTVILLFFLGGNAYSQSSHAKVDEEHADKFGYLVTQSFGKRYVPVHSLAIDVMHKLSRKNEFEAEGKGKMTCMEVFLDMMIDPEFWKDQPVVNVKDNTIRDMLGVEGKYASFNQFFDKNGSYKLYNQASQASRKNNNLRNKFDREVLKTDEKFNIMYMAMNGSLLKIFPDFSNPSGEWVTWDDKQAQVPLKGSFGIINQDLKLDVLNFRNILITYLQALSSAVHSGNYAEADKIYSYLDAIQRHSSTENIIPNRTKIKYDVYYNKARMFDKLKKWYSYLALVLLILAFSDNLRSKKSKILTYALNFFIALLAAAFAYHTYGMGLRWYLSGHAPWSNGYEALLLVGWGSVLAGFIFIRNSKIILAATTLMAFLALMTAGHSSYDPQLTNLVPVLRSYWLIIHVASMTISYCFLGLGFILGIINLFIYIFRNKQNKKRFDLIIEELTYTNEISLTIGLVLAVAGTFLGAVWANESWGRYWGWDAKETWALIILFVYTLILHLRLVPSLKGKLLFNASSVIGFGSVLMTFIGVNYYLTKGMHSYAGGEKQIFPTWAWIAIFFIFALITIAKARQTRSE